MTTSTTHPTRRALLVSAAGATCALALPFPRPAIARTGPLKIGVLLPYSGTYAQLAESITRGMQLRIARNGGKLAGRDVVLVALDDESSPPKAPELTTKLIQSEKVDVLTGPVHSGVAMAMCKIAREDGIPTIVSNAGANVLTRGQCARNIFRTSFANGQLGVATGTAMRDAGIKSVVTFTWRYAAGEEMVEGFKEAFLKGGGTVLKDITVPFPMVEFQSGLAEIAALKPQAVYSFFSGGGAVKFVTDYAAAGLSRATELWGPGFLTEGVERAIGRAGEGIKGVLHHVGALDTPENVAFRSDFVRAHGIPPDVFAVQGHDTVRLLEIGLAAVDGDASKREALCAAMAKASFASPRGPFRLSASHNPVQNFYLREFVNGADEMRGTVVTALADHTAGCRLAS